MALPSGLKGCLGRKDGQAKRTASCRHHRHQSRCQPGTRRGTALPAHVVPAPWGPRGLARAGGAAWCWGGGRAAPVPRSGEDAATEGSQGRTRAERRCVVFVRNRRGARAPRLPQGGTLFSACSWRFWATTPDGRGPTCSSPGEDWLQFLNLDPRCQTALTPPPWRSPPYPFHFIFHACLFEELTVQQGNGKSF